MRANCGSACSERYSSSPLTRTMRLPLPGPFLPAITSRSAGAAAHVRVTASSAVSPRRFIIALILAGFLDARFRNRIFPIRSGEQRSGPVHRQLIDIRRELMIVIHHLVERDDLAG